ncbi:signal peptidase II [Erythrobacteraceae bacterium CFH 75059]|uniref:signal peptidase II n=1 Tax=Qipengyuania thermophila TaxID=2509361 RepID=UPI001020CA5A|nr:signal peptidase II [Qipengyuania thermophila]TCD06751.1 signal peptidase II [Erythrobacteraceae bacterium CFH 75059]
MRTVLTRNRIIGLSIALGIFVVDQLVKWYVSGPLALQERGVIDVLPFFDLRWVENHGVSLGMLQATSDTMRWVLVVVTFLIAVGVTIWMMREHVMGEILGLALILGGALGNIRDRFLFGYVIDYADFHIGEWRPFLVFNIADAAISVGVVIILLRAFFVRDARTPSPAGPAGPDRTTT